MTDRPIIDYNYEAIILIMPKTNTTTKKATKKNDAPMTPESKSRILKGIVVSDKMNKTRVVAITRLIEHPKYGKRYKSTSKFKAHDEDNKTKQGDMVSIKEIRPMSKEKRWLIV